MENQREAYQLCLTFCDQNHINYGLKKKHTILNHLAERALHTK